MRLASALRPYAGGEPCLELDLPAPVVIGDVIGAIERAYPAVGRRLRDETGAMRRHVNVFVGGENARDVDDLSTLVPEGVEVSVFPAVSGGL